MTGTRRRHQKPLPHELDKPLPPEGVDEHRSKAQLIGAAPAAVDVKAPWPDLSDEQGCEMGQTVALLKEAANQWHLKAQAACGNLYCFGWGVT